MRTQQMEPGPLPRNHVCRHRLLEKLSTATQGKLTLLCANAGYGKTTLMSEYLGSSGQRAEWYHLTASDRDIAHLAEGLEKVIRRMAVELESRGNRSRYRQSETSNPSILASRLLKHAERMGPEVVLLVLDEYQNVAGSDGANALLGEFIENSPPHLRFVVLSRGAPRFPLGRLSARQELSTIGEDDLTFNVDETARFLRCIGETEAPQVSVELVLERTEGWAAGIAMVSQSLRYGSGERVAAVLADPAASAWLVYDYLAEEVFDKQPKEVQDFLVKTSVLEMMTAPLCDKLLESSASQLTLLSLEDQGLFTTSMDPARRTFRYHQLFREFLRQKLHQRESQDTIRGLHCRASEFYEGEQGWDAAVRHYLKASEPLRAARLVETVGERYIFSGYSQTVDRWIRDLPEDLTSTRPWLLALRGRLCHLSVRNEESQRLLERALRLFQAEGDEVGQSWASGEIAFVMFRSSQLEQAIQRFADALSMANGESALRSQLLVMQAMAYREAGMLQQSVEACKASIQEAAGIEDKSRRMWLYSRATRNLAFAQMEMGMLEPARRNALDALDHCVTHELGEFEEGWILAQLGAILWSCGEIEESLRVLNRSLSLSGRYIRHLQQFASLWLGNALRDAGQYVESDQTYARGSGVAELERLHLGALRGRHRDIRAATESLRRQYQGSELVVERATAKTVSAIVLMGCEEWEKALEQIRDAVGVFQTHSYRHRLASALFHQSQIEYELRREAESRESLRLALELASTDGYRHFFWWDSRLVASLCSRALVDGMYPDYVLELATSRLDSRSVVAFAPLLQDRRQEVRRRAQEVMARLPDRGSVGLAEQLLAGCGDSMIKANLLKALHDSVISPQGVQTLRVTYDLSWREVEVFAEYYLRPASGRRGGDAALRREYAERLGIAEHTLRCHVNNLRRKLSLPAWVSGRSILDWAQQEGLLPSPSERDPSSQGLDSTGRVY